jgi:hypothetical protein
MLKKMQVLPGSDRMLDGSLSCMVLELQPMVIGNCTFGNLYMHISNEKSRPYDNVDREAVMRAVECVRKSPTSSYILFEKKHVAGHPLPGVFTVNRSGYRIDFRVYGPNLWAEVMRQVSLKHNFHGTKNSRQLNIMLQALEQKALIRWTDQNTEDVS